MAGIEEYVLSKEEKAVINRIAKIIGHLKAVQSMVENGRDCSEVLIQLAACKSAINSAGKILLQDYIKDCVHEIVENGKNHGHTQQQEKKREMDRVINMFIK